MVPGGPGGSRTTVNSARWGYSSSASPDESMDITPDEITIQEVVEACFQLVDHPDGPERS